MEKVVYFYVFDTMADWEAGYAAAELNTGRFFREGADRYRVKTVGLRREAVVTMGGVRIQPEISLEECRGEEAGLLLLPGGETWLKTVHDPVLAMAREYLEQDIPVAGICGATLGLARTGVLDRRYHTSNDLDYLKNCCPRYAGEKFYRFEPAVTDGNLITASGIGPVEFAREIFRRLAIFSDRALEAWYYLFKTQETRYFYALMAAVDE